MAAQTPPTTEECAAILGRVDGSLRLWRATTDTALADACDAIALLMVHLDATTIPVPLCSELYTSPIDAAEGVALVRDTLADRVGAGYRRDSIRAAAGLLRHALRAYVAPPVAGLALVLVGGATLTLTGADAGAAVAVAGLALLALQPRHPEEG